MQLLYLISAALLGSEVARRIFHVEFIIQDPNVQELIRAWEARGILQEARSNALKVLAVRASPVPRTWSPASTQSRTSRSSRRGSKARARTLAVPPTHRTCVNPLSSLQMSIETL